MNHPHQLLQRLRLELAHGKDALVQPRAGACSQSFLFKNTKQITVDSLKCPDTSQAFRRGFVINQNLFNGGLNSDISWSASLEMETNRAAGCLLMMM